MNHCVTGNLFGVTSVIGSMDEWEENMREMLGDLPEVYGVDSPEDFPDKVPAYSPVLDLQYERTIVKDKDGQLHTLRIEELLTSPTGDSEEG